jgi:hypothetical protein
MITNSTAALGFVFVCCGIMLGAGVGALYKSVALGIMIGAAIGGLVAALTGVSRRSS